MGLGLFPMNSVPSLFPVPQPRLEASTLDENGSVLLAAVLHK